MADQGLVMPSSLRWSIGHLGPLLSVPVRGEVPSPRPASFVRITQAGGDSRQTVLGAVQLMVESWAATELEAEALANRVSGLLMKGRGVPVSGIVCRRVSEFGLPYSSPDPDTGSPRWRQLVSVTFRKSTI